MLEVIWIVRGTAYPMHQRHPDLSTGEYVYGENMDARQRAFVLDRYKAIYIEIPKAACSSIKLALGSVAGLSAEELAPLLNEGLPFVNLRDPAYRDYFVFSFVRNSWDRLVSCYVSKFDIPASEKRDDFEQLYIKPLKEALHTEEISFHNFLLYACGQSDDAADVHWRQQHRFITDQNLQPLVNYVGRFENLESDFAHVMKIAGFKAELPHHNRSPHRTSDYRTYYTDDDRDLVARRYAEEISIFDFHF